MNLFSAGSFQSKLIYSFQLICQSALPLSSSIHHLIVNLSSVLPWTGHYSLLSAHLDVILRRQQKKSCIVDSFSFAVSEPGRCRGARRGRFMASFCRGPSATEIWPLYLLRWIQWKWDQLKREGLTAAVSAVGAWRWGGAGCIQRAGNSTLVSLECVRAR